MGKILQFIDFNCDFTISYKLSHVWQYTIYNIYLVLFFIFFVKFIDFDCDLRFLISILQSSWVKSFDFCCDFTIVNFTLLFDLKHKPNFDNYVLNQHNHANGKVNINNVLISIYMKDRIYLKCYIKFSYRLSQHRY